MTTPASHAPGGLPKGAPTRRRLRPERSLPQQPLPAGPRP